MNRSVFSLLIAIFLFFSFGTVSSFAAHKFIAPTSTPKPKKIAEIEKIELDKTEVIIPCPPFRENFFKNNRCYKEDRLVKVFTSVNNPKKLSLSYSYTVSGGKIIGEGENVVWDLIGVNRGTFTITVSINGKGKVSKLTKTQTLKVITCPHCEVPCEVCPNLSISGGGNVKAGENVDFTVNVEPDFPEYSLYKWTVSEGEIIEGQGNGKITVKTTREMIGKTITATVSVEKVKNSDACPICNLTESATAFVIE